MHSRIMYIERKTDGITGPSHIGRVTFSKSGRTIYYQGKTSNPAKVLGLSATILIQIRMKVIGFPAVSKMEAIVCIPERQSSTMTFARNTGRLYDGSPK